MDEIILNKVANSGLITIDLEDYRPKNESFLYDLKQNLFMDQILREKDFREFLKLHNWQQYSGKNVAITCSEEVLIPTWAYMLLISKLQPFANKIIFGNLDILNEEVYNDSINSIDIEPYRDSRVVIKGCSKGEVPASVYMKITNRLLPIVQSLMFGEPCSTVPIYKKPKEV